MKIEPEGVKCLISPQIVEEKTSGGIYRPPTARDQEQYAVIKGKVLAIGPAAQVEFDSGQLEVGDEVIFAKYGGMVVRDEDAGTDLRVVNDEDIIAKVS